MKCEVCGAEFMPKREYTVFAVGLRDGYYDAMDCEKCGCQIILKLRHGYVEGPKVSEKTMEILKGWIKCQKKNDCEFCCDTCKFGSYTDEELVEAMEEIRDKLENGDQ